MGSIRLKLQNIILKNEYLNEHIPMMYYGKECRYSEEKSALFIKSADFFTYFNSLSLYKWKKYTNAGKIGLNLVCEGKCKITLFGYRRENKKIKKEIFLSKEYDLKEKTEIALDIPENVQANSVGFRIDGNCILYSGYWSAETDEAILNDVKISVVTVTFRKEDYIRRNAAILKKELFESNESVKENIRLRIIDNDKGRVLSAEEFTSEYVYYTANENVGGSGGYTRGMIESLNDASFRPTHILLMDDDVIVLTESFIRTYALLRLVKKEYDGRFISGAMLFYEKPDIQYEDVGYVHDDGSYGPNKRNMHLEKKKDVFENDEDFQYHENSYAGWWYCCIPVKKMDKNKLPIPLFVRGDDVEFSLANHAEFLSLNGICIWHKGFADKFNANTELYMVHRNSLIIQAVSGICKDIDFIKRIDDFFWNELRRLSYDNCELLLDSIEDFCKGPAFLYEPKGEEIMKAHAAKSEKMQPVRNIDFDDIYKRSEKPLNYLQFMIYHKTRNGHRLPDFMLKNKTAVIAYDWFDDPPQYYLAKEILAVNKSEKTAYLRKRDKKRYKELIQRRDRVIEYYENHREEIEKAYREAGKVLKTESFWKKYLGIKS